MAAIDTFKSITKYDLKAFFNRFSSFMDDYFESYVAYYKGEGDLKKEAVNEVNYLRAESQKIEEIFSVNTLKLSGDTSFWDLYDDFSDVFIKIQSIIATPKYQRSSYINDFDSVSTVDYILKQGQSLENLARDLGIDSPEDEWVNIAINNQLQEGDYTFEGGNKLQVKFRRINDINVSSVIDILNGENVLGKDLTIYVQIVDGDELTLTPQETFRQGVEIVLGVTKGSIPEFPDDGIGKENLGTNVNAFRYPIIQRQLIELIKKDDTIKSFSVDDIKIEEDAVFVSTSIKSKLDDVLSQNIYING